MYYCFHTHSHDDTILVFGLSPKEHQAVDAANQYTEYQCLEAGCVTDLLSIPHLALIVNPTAMSQEDWAELMDHYRDVPEDGAKAFFTRFMLVPADVTAEFHFTRGAEELQCMLAAHFCHHAPSSGKARELQEILRDYAREYPYIFCLCSFSDHNLLTDLHMVAKEFHLPFILRSEYQCDIYLRKKAASAINQLKDAVSRLLKDNAFQTRELSFHVDFDRVLIYSEDLLPLMEEEGFFMPVSGDRQDFLSLLERFNNSSSLLLYSVNPNHVSLVNSIADWWQGEIAWDTFLFS